MEGISENGDFGDTIREQLPERLGDVYFNDPETKQQPTKELDNVSNIFDMAKMVVTGSRKISAHGEELKNATAGMIKVPGEGATEDEIKAYRMAQGVPDSHEGYEMPVPKDVFDADKLVYEGLAKSTAVAAHEAGIPPSKIIPVFEKVINAVATQNKALEKQGTELLAADVQALKDSKKEKYDSFIADTNKVSAHFDIKADAALGTKDNLIGSNFMKLMDSMGIKDTPTVREFLGAIGPLVLEGSTAIGRGAESKGGSEGGFDYEYDEHGKPV